MNHQKNAKYQRTDSEIRRAFLEIIEENREPTVVEIARRSGINRSAFYLHYETLADLFDAVREDIYAEVAAENERLAQAGDPELYFRSHKSYLIFARHVKRHQSYYRQFFRLQTSFPIERSYDRIIRLLRPMLEQNGRIDDRVLEERFVCYQAAFTHCLKSWVDHGCDLSEDCIADILADCACI